MAVDSTDKLYGRLAPQWQLMRDASAGEQQVKEAGELYLPKLGGQDADEYGAFKARASYYNATGRTIDGLSGMIFRKPPIVEHPAILEALAEDVTLGGIGLQNFAEQAVEEVLTVGRAGVLVDFPSVDTAMLTQAQAEQMNLRPMWSLYTAESILAVKTGQVGNQSTLTQVRLRETVSEPGKDEFEEVEIEQIRVLDLSDAGYRQRVFRRDDKGQWFVHDEIIPQMHGAPLDFIPFVFLGPRDSSPTMAKPPLIDLANKNMDHYRQNADWQHARHFLAAGMTPWACGVDQKDIEAGAFDFTGPTNIWLTTSPDAKFGVIEFSGAGMDAMRQGMQDAEQAMAALGARMLAPDKRQAEAAETAAIHRQGEISVLASLSQAVSISLTQALEIARDWMGIDGDVSVTLNTDFLPAKMNPQELTALMQLWQSGGISFGTLFDNLQQGEIIGAEKTAEEEQSEIETGGDVVAGLRAVQSVQ